MIVIVNISHRALLSEIEMYVVSEKHVLRDRLSLEQA
jgi:hypothetical protein